MSSKGKNDLITLKSHCAFGNYVYLCELINWCFESLSCQSLQADCPGLTEDNNNKQTNKKNRANIAELDLAWAAVDLFRIFKMQSKKVTLGQPASLFKLAHLPRGARRARKSSLSFFHLLSTEEEDCVSPQSG